MRERFADTGRISRRERAEEIANRSRRNIADLAPARRTEILKMLDANLAEMTEDEDRQITDNAEADPDNPPIEDKAFDRWERRGRPPLDNPKQKVTIRLDADILANLRAEGPGWQSRANALLRKAVGLK